MSGPTKVSSNYCFQRGPHPGRATPQRVGRDGAGHGREGEGVRCRGPGRRAGRGGPGQAHKGPTGPCLACVESVVYSAHVRKLFGFLGPPPAAARGSAVR